MCGLCGKRKGATMMKHSSMFNECERFLKRVLKDKGLFSKGAVIAYLITGGIGFVAPVLLGDSVYAATYKWVKIQTDTGRTFGDGEQDGETNSVILAPTSGANSGALAVSDTYTIYPGLFNRKARNSVILGYGAYANALSTETTPGSFTAIGALSHAYGGQGTAVGSGTIAGIQATAIGNDVYATGDSSIAIGNDDIATKYRDQLSLETMKSVYGAGPGQGLFASKEFQSSDGNFKKQLSVLDWNRFSGSYLTGDKLIYNPTISRGIGSIAIGSRSIAAKDGSTAIGTLAYAFAEGSTAMGLRAFTSTDAVGAVAIGEQSRSFAKGSLAVGNRNESTSLGSMSYGYNAKAVGEGSLAFGYNVLANASITNTIVGAGDTKPPTNVYRQALMDNTQGFNYEQLKYIRLYDASLKEYAEILNKPITDTYTAEAKQRDIDHYSKNVTDSKAEYDKVIKAFTNSGANVAGKGGRNLEDVNNLDLVNKADTTDKSGNTVTAVGTVINDIVGKTTNAADNTLKVSLVEDVEAGKYLTTTDKNADGTESKKEIYKLKANGKNAIAIGYYTAASGDSSIAQGAGSIVEGSSGIGIGSLSYVSGEAKNGIAMGVGSQVRNANSIAIGTQAAVYGAKGIGMGPGARVIGDESMAIGYGSFVKTKASTALGVGTTIEYGANESMALGTKAYVGIGNIATLSIGNNARVEENSVNSTSIGASSKIGKQSSNSVVLGTSSTIGDLAANSVVLGANATISNNSSNSMALGAGAKITDGAKSSIALGEGSSVSESNSLAFGRKSSVSGESSIAIGRNALVKTDSSIALGRSATADYKNSVALGYRSITFYYGDEKTRQAGTSSTASGTYKHGLDIEPYLPDSAGKGIKEKLAHLNTAAAGYISVGGWDVTKNEDGSANADGAGATLRGLRRIVNVAPGALDTDVVTVAQLREWTDKSSHFLSLAGADSKSATDFADETAPDGSTTVHSNFNNDGASGLHALALGVYAKGAGAGSISIGRSSFGQGANSTTIGSYAWGRGTDATVVGTHAYGYGENSVTMGTHAVTDADYGISIGNRSRVFSEGGNGNAGIAIGNKATANYWNAMALGSESKVRGFHSTALGAYARIGVPETLDDTGLAMNAFGSDGKIRNKKGQVIYERVLQADGLTSDANGMTTVKEYEPGTTTVKRTFQIQEVSKVDNALAFGNSATVENEKVQYTENGVKKEKTVASNGSIAIGTSASVKGSQNSIALGLNSKVVYTDTKTKSTAAFTGDENNDPGNGVLSLGNSSGVTRRIIHVAGGANDDDAVNVKQLKAAVKYYKTNTSDTTNRTVNGIADVSANYNGEGATGTASVTLGSYTKASGDYSTAIGRDVITSGRTAVGVGTNVSAFGDSSVVLGNEAIAGYTKIDNSKTVPVGATEGVAIGKGAKVESSYTVAIGGNAQVVRDTTVATDIKDAESSIAIGASAKVTGAKYSVALGLNSKVTYNDTKSKTTAAFSNEENNDPTNGVVSIGDSAGLKRRLINVAGGANDYDAVNVKQLKAAAWGLQVQNGTSTKDVTPVGTGDLRKITLKAGSNVTLDNNNGVVTINASGGLNSITSSNNDVLGVSTTAGAVTLTPKVATTITGTGDDANKLVTSGVVNTAIGNIPITSFKADAGGATANTGGATANTEGTFTPTADKKEINITGAGKDGTEKQTWTQGTKRFYSDNIGTHLNSDGRVLVGLNDELSVKNITTYKYGADGKRTTNAGASLTTDGLAGNGTDALTISNGDYAKITVNKGTSATDKGSIDVNGSKITGLADGTIGAGSTDAVTGGQLYSKLAEKANASDLAGKLNKTAELHVRKGDYTVGTNGEVSLIQEDADGTEKTDKAFTIKNIATKDSVDTLTGKVNTNTTNIANLTTTVGKAITFKDNDGQGVAKKLGEALSITGEGTVPTGTNTAANNIKTTKLADGSGLQIGLADKLTNMKGITGTDGFTISSGGTGTGTDIATMTFNPKKTTGGTTTEANISVNKVKLTGLKDAELSAASTDAVTGKQLYATNTNVTNLTTKVTNNTNNITNLMNTVNANTNLGYKADGETTAKKVAVGTGLTFKPGTGTVGATGAGASTTNAETVKKGIAISTEANGVVNIGLDADTRTAIDNAANKDLGNLSDTGKGEVKKLANEAVKFGDGKNTKVNSSTASNVTTYKIDAYDTKLTGTTEVTVGAGDTADTNNVRNYTIGLSQATKETLAKVATLETAIGKNGADGRDGKPGITTGTTAAGMGKDGLTGADGLNGKDLTTKVNALRNGEAGTVVYTDDQGNRVVKANDGKWYDSRVVDETGALKATADIPAGVSKAEVTTPQARLVNPDGTTVAGAGNKAVTKLSNIADGTIAANSHDAVTGGQLHTVKQDVATNTQNITSLTNKVNTNTTDINTLKTNVDKSITFSADTGTAATRKLGSTLAVKGGDNFTPAATDKNIRVTSDNTTGLTVHLADTLTKMKGISGTGTSDFVIKNGDNAVITVKAPTGTDTKGTVDFGGTKLTNLGNGTIAAGSTDAVTGDQLNSKLAEKANVSDLTGKVDKTAERHINSGSFNANTGTITLNMVDGTGASKADENVSITGIPTELGYKANGETTTNKVALGTGLTFKAGTGTIAPTGLAAGAASTTASTDNVVTKTGIKITTEENGVVNIGLDEATRKAIDNAANKDLGNLSDTGKNVIKTLANEAVKLGDGKNTKVNSTTTNNVTTYTVDAYDTHVAGTTDEIEVTPAAVGTDNVRNYTIGLSQATKDTLAKVSTLETAIGKNGADGRDGKPGTGTAAGMGKDGVTGKDGLNGTDLTTKVNALRNGEAGTVVYTDESGNRVVRASDGKFYNANEVKADGSVKNKVENGGKEPTEVTTIQARLVNPDGTTVPKAGAVNGAATTKLSNIAEGAITSTSNDAVTGRQLHAAETKIAEALGGGAAVGTDGTVTKPTYTITKDGATTGTETADNVGTAITKLDTRINTLKGNPLTFSADTGTAATRKLGETLAVKGGDNFTSGTAGKNIQVQSNAADGLTVHLADTLTNMKGISGTGTSDLVIKNGDHTTITIKPGTAAPASGGNATPGTVDFGKAKLTNVGKATTDGDVTNKKYVDDKVAGLNLGYKAETEPGKSVAVTTGLTFKAGTGTTGTSATGTDAMATKTGIAISTAENGVVNIGLDEATRKVIDKAAKLGDTAVDGRDGKAANGKTGAAGNAGDHGLTGKDGLNGTDLTTKVNALRNGEAGTVVYTDKDGNRLVKANDGNYYKADQVNKDGNVITLASGTAPTPATPVEARLVNPDGTTSPNVTDADKKALTKLSNIAEGTISDKSNDAVTGRQLYDAKKEVGDIIGGTTIDGNGKITGPTFTITKADGTNETTSTIKGAIEKLNTTNVDQNTKITNLMDGKISFVGNTATDKVERKLGETLNIKGQNNISVTKATGTTDTLNVSLASDLKNITSITNADGDNKPGTKIQLGTNELTITNTQAPATGATAGVTKTVTIGKDGIDAGGMKITNVAKATADGDATNKKYVDDAISNLNTKVTNNANLRYAGDTNVGTATGENHLNLALATGTLKVAGTADQIKTEAENGTITVSLHETVTKQLDKLGNTAADGRDGKPGIASGSTTAGIGAQGPTGKDGLNGKTITEKVNALRNGEAGTVVYTDENGERVVRASDGKFYNANEVKADGAVKTKAENGGKEPTEVTTIQARLVNPDGTTVAGADNQALTKLSNIAEGAVTSTSNDAVTGRQLHTAKTELATALGGNAAVDANGTWTPPTYTITKDGTTAGTDTVNNVGDAVSKLDTRINTLKGNPLTFTGDDNQGVTRTLGETLTVKGGANVDTTATTMTNGVNIRVVKDATSGANGLTVHLADTLTNMKGISGNGTNDLVIKNGTNEITITPGKPATGTTKADPGTVNFGDATVTVKNLDASISYKANSEMAKTVKLQTGLNFIEGDGTATTNADAKSGLKIATGTDGKVIFGLNEATRNTIDNAANKDLSNLSTTGTNKVKELAQGAVKVAAGKNAMVTADDSTANATTYVVDANDTTVSAASSEIVVSGGTLNANRVREYTVGLSQDVKDKLNNLGKIGNTVADGRDGKTADGSGTTAGDHGLTGKDGLNGKDLTTKVNALRNGEAGTVVYTDDKGNRLVKTNDGKWYPATAVGDNGELKPVPTGGTAPVEVKAKDVVASLVSPDGTTTNATTVLNNVGSALASIQKDTATKAEDTNYLDKLAKATDGTSKVANSVVNVTDLKKTADAIIDKGLTFKGNDGTDIPKALGSTLSIVGEGNYGTPAVAPATAAKNIFTKHVTENNVTRLEIGLVKDLVGITSIANETDTTKPITKVDIGNDGITVTNTQPVPTGAAAGTQPVVTKTTIGKEGVKVGDTVTLDKAGISGNGTNPLTITNGANTKITVTPSTATDTKGTVDFGGARITNIADPTTGTDAVNKAYVDGKIGNVAEIGYKANAETTTKKVAVGTGLHFKSGTGTIAPTGLAAGTTSPTSTTDGITTKTGIAISTEAAGIVNIGLDEATRKVIDKAAKLGNTAVDGRDGKPGTGANAGMGRDGLTGADGMNGKDLTSKVNALRNGEAGTVVYTNTAGERLVKADDGKFYKATDVDEHGKVKTPAAGDPAPVGLTADKVIASLVSPDGTTAPKATDTAKKAMTKLSNIAEGAITSTSNDAVTGRQIHGERKALATALGGNAAVADDGTWTAPTYTITNDGGTNHTVHSVGDAVTKLDARITDARDYTDTKVAAATTAGMNFAGDDNASVHRDLGDTLTVKGGKNFDPTATATKADAGVNIRVEKDATAGTNGLTVKLADTLTNMKGISGNGTDNLVIKNGTNTITITPGKAAAGKTPADPGKVDFGDATVTVKNLDASITYRANGASDADAKTVKLKQGLDFVAGTGTIGNATTGTDVETTKKGIAITTGENGKVYFGLDADTRKTIDNAAKIGNTASDGRDGKTADGTGVAAGDKGVTGKDGLNGKDLTNKVNALRNGEAGTVVYTDADGNRLVKANDGKYYKANEVKDDGTVKSIGEDGITETPVAVATDKVIASLVSPDGTTAPKATDADKKAMTKLSNIAEGAITSTSNDAVTGRQIHAAKTELIDKGLDFYGNDAVEATGKVHRKLGEKLTLEGAGTFTRGATDSNNIKVERKATADGFDVKLAENLTKMKEVAGNDTDTLVLRNGKDDATHTKVEIGTNKFAVTNSTSTPATTPGTAPTVTTGKLEMDADGTTTFTNSGAPANAVAINSKNGTVTVGNDVAGQPANTNKVVVNGSNATITAGTADDKKVTVDGANGTLVVGGDAASTNANKVTVNGTTGTITTGNTTVNGSSVSVIAGTKSVVTTESGTTITNGTVTTTATAGKTEYKDGNNVTTVNTAGMTVTDGTNNATYSAGEATLTKGTHTATHTATRSTYEDGTGKSVETTASGITAVDGTDTASYTASGSTFTDADGTAMHTAAGTTFTNADHTVTHTANGSTFEHGTNVGTYTAGGATLVDGTTSATHTAGVSTYTDGTNTVAVGTAGITITPSAAGGATSSVSLTTAGLNNGGNVIANVAAGTVDTDAVNLKQLKAGKTTFSVNDKDGTTTNHNLVLTTTTDAKDGHTHYDVKLADKVTLGTAANAVTVDGTNGTIKAGKDANAVTVDGTKASITAGKDDKAVTVDGTKASITAGKDDKAVTVDGTKASITAGKDDKAVTVDGTKASITAGKDDKAVTVDGTKASITAGKDDKAVTVDGTKASITAGKDDKAVTVDGTKASITAGKDDKAVTVDGTKASITAGTGANAITADGAKATLVVGGTGATTDSANKVTINGTDGTIKTGKTEVSGSAVTITDAMNAAKKTTVDATGTTVTDGVANGKKVVTTVDGTTFTNATNGTQVGATLIRVNGDNNAGAITNGISIGKQSVTTTEIGEAPTTTTKTETGNFITGLDNKTWDPKTNGIVSGRAATEDQLKVVDDKVNKGRVFSADTLDANKKPVEAMVGLGDTLSIVGGADMKALTDNNIGVELKAAETKDGVTTPATMTVKLAKNVKMGDGSTTYNTYLAEYERNADGSLKLEYDRNPDGTVNKNSAHSIVAKNADGSTKYQTDTEGNKIAVRTVTHNGDATYYTLHEVDKKGHLMTDAKGNPLTNVETGIGANGIEIASGPQHNKPSVTLTSNGLNNGGNRITNVAPGVEATDAVNVGQVNSITTVLDRRINQTGAKAAAMAAMKPLMYDPLKKSQIMAGFGAQKGAQALALGVAHYFNEDVMVNMGLSVGAGDNMMNAGVTYRFGGDDSMIPERYKGGPISSIYVMQDEISALKAENEQVKSENAQIKADNSQVRADNERMKASYEKIMEDNAQMKQDNEEMKAQIKMLMAHMGIK